MNGTKINEKIRRTCKEKTCAIVSNSGDLMNHEYGSLIDSMML